MHNPNDSIKILFTDMDGTLLLNNSTVSDEMKAALDRLIRNGHKLVLTSGRPLDSILEVMQASDLFYPGTLVISNNGSLIYDCTAGAPLMEKRSPSPLPPASYGKRRNWESIYRPTPIMKSYVKRRRRGNLLP